MPLPQGGHQGLGLEALGLHMDPAAEEIIDLEMGIVGGEGGEPRSVIEQLVVEIPPFAAIGLDGAAMVVDLDRMCRRERPPVLKGELRPCGMRDADKRPGRGGPLGKGRPALVGRAGGKSSGKPAATMCQSSPTAVSGACSSAPMMVVNRFERIPLVSAIGQP